jgi:hypothetical protein
VNWLVRVVAGLLEGEEREAVVGDLLESGLSATRVTVEITGLFVRRQFALWQNWRPWLAAFGLALPFSFVLMGWSVSVSRGYQQALDPHLAATPVLWLSLCNALLLCGWAWTGGFVMGTLSRRTLWVSALFCFVPCLYCLSLFHVECLSRLCLFLFLIPAGWGLYRGLRIQRIPVNSAILLAVAVTVLTIPTWTHSGAWLPNWALSWPAWYLVATARRS